MNMSHAKSPHRRPPFSAWRLLTATILSLLALGTAAPAATYWVSPTGGGNGQSSASPWTLAQANAAVGPGDTVRLKAGTYLSQQIKPLVSGTSALPITYIKDTATTTAILSLSFGGNQPQADFTGLDWIVVDGISFEKSQVWQAAMLRNSTFIKIRNCSFDSGSTGGPNGDHIWSDFSSNILIDTCTFGKAPHMAVNIQEGSHHVIVKNCTMQNLWHSNAGAFSGAGKALIYNVVYQDNLMYDNGLNYSNNPGSEGNFSNGLEVEAQNCIFRRNIMDTTVTPYAPPDSYSTRAMSMTSWGHSSSGNRTYNNILSRHALGIYMHGNTTNPPPYVNQNNVWKNNIFYLIVTNQVDAQGLDSTGSSLFVYNSFYGVQAFKYKSGTVQTLTQLQASSGYPNEWQNNVGSAAGGAYDPQFVSVASRNFALQSTSPMRDAGDFLTRTTNSSGGGVTMTVQDAKYFCDGFGLIPGDTIQIGNYSPVRTATIASISGNTLTLSANATWANNDTVSLPYSGAKPDMGVFEYTAPSAPNAPSNLVASAPTSSTINLSWTDNSSAPNGETGFEIDRATNSTFTTGPAPITNAYTTGANPAMPFTATGLSPGTLYYFRVRATNGLDSPNSNTDSATTSGGGTTATFTSDGTADGWVLESGETTGVGGSINSTDATTSALRVGDDAAKKQYKAILSFPTGTLPDGATILSATLKLKRGTQSGTVTALGTLRVDQRTYYFNDAEALEAADFSATATVTQAATLNVPTTNGALATGNLTSAGLAAINKLGKTQFRVYFSTDDNNNAANDYLGFYSGNDATAANRPVLEVTYQ
jgi:hypothetical protein